MKSWWHPGWFRKTSPDMTIVKSNLPPPPTRVVLRSHPKAPYLGLVISDDQPNLSAFETGDFLRRMFDCFWNTANGNDRQSLGV